VTGAGGIGKTRLAVRLACDLVNECPDGVWLVDLAPLSTARISSRSFGCLTKNVHPQMSMVMAIPNRYGQQDRRFNPGSYASDVQPDSRKHRDFSIIRLVASRPGAWKMLFSLPGTATVV
jgi:hypothetical protein